MLCRTCVHSGKNTQHIQISLCLRLQLGILARKWPGISRNGTGRSSTQSAQASRRPSSLKQWSTPAKTDRKFVSDALTSWATRSSWTDIAESKVSKCFQRFTSAYSTPPRSYGFCQEDCGEMMSEQPWDTFLDPRYSVCDMFLWIIFSGQGPIPQGLQQILMASFWFGAKEPQRDFGLDPGSWNETVFFESYFQAGGPFHRVFNRF